MPKDDKPKDNRPKDDKSDKKDAAEARLEQLQIALVDAQIWSQKEGKRLCVVFEGRDTAGKDGAIKRITECLSIRQTRVVALPKPTEREQGEWWFQRYASELPTAGEWVLFNRSWYNRAGVEKVMAFPPRSSRRPSSAMSRPSRACWSAPISSWSSYGSISRGTNRNSAWMNAAPIHANA